MKQYTYKENDTSLSHSSDPMKDMPNVALPVNWGNVERFLRTEIPLSERKAFIDQYGIHIKTIDTIKTWERIAINFGIGASIVTGAIHAVVIGGGLGKVTKVIMVITIAIAIVFIIVDEFYKNKFIKAFKSSSKMVETAQMVRESIIDYVKEPTVAAIKKASLVILPMLQSIWNYFFGEKDEVFSDLTIRRRRQLVLFGVILIVSLMAYLFKTDLRTDIMKTSYPNYKG